MGASSGPGFLKFVFRLIPEIFSGALLVTLGVVAVFIWFCGDYDDFKHIVNVLSDTFEPVSYGSRCTALHC
jgi:hypothetical protein